MGLFDFFKKEKDTFSLEKWERERKEREYEACQAEADRLNAQGRKRYEVRSYEIDHGLDRIYEVVEVD